MPPDLPNEQELILKKRARRRLVGAIALVLLMIIILPMILKDRATLDSQEAIKISMSDSKVDTFNSTVVPIGGNVEAPKPEEGGAVPDTPADDVVEVAKPETIPEVKSAEVKEPSKANTEKPIITKPVVSKPAVAKVETKPEVKSVETKKPEPVKTPDATVKNSGSFTVQIGVFSDAANVKQLQDKLKQAGYSSHTENIATPKGEKIRLRTSNFSSRQDADAALSKIKQAGLSGLVMPI